MTVENKRLARLAEDRATIATKLRNLADLAEEETRELTDSETQVRDTGMAELTKLDAEIQVESSIELRNAEADKLASRVNSARDGIEVRTNDAGNLVQVHEDKFYNASNAIERSWFRDIVNASGKLPGGNMRQARENLDNYAKDLNLRSVTTTTAVDVTPPSYLIDDLARFARSGRPVANAIGSLPLAAGGGMDLYIPRGTAGTAVGVQTTENAGTGIGNSDPTFSPVQAHVQSIAGYTDVSLQELRQASISIDQEIFRDLVLAYNSQVETLCVNGTGTNAKGIFQLAGTNAVSYPGSALGTFRANEFYAKVIEGEVSVEANRFAPAEVVLMSPRRWGLTLSKSDTTNRPLVAPIAPMNSGGSFSIGVEGYRGEFAGLPVLTSYAVPTAVAEGGGATPTGDAVAVLRLSDLRLYESPVESATFDDIGSGTLTVRFRVHSFVAFAAGRYPTGITLITGAALTDSTF
jgi:HK97 family phage major capsid protein